MLEDDFFLGTKLYQKKFTELCKPITDYMGIVSAHYINVDKHGKALTIYSLDKWGERVLEKQYYKVETGMVHPDNINNGFALCNASDNEEYKNTLLYDGSVHSNWWHAFVHIEKRPDNSGYTGLGFATTKDNYKIHNILMNELSIIKNFIKSLDENLMSVIGKDLEDHKMDLAAIKGDAFYSQKGVVFNQEAKNKHKIGLLKKLGLITGEDFLKMPTLSPQEVNCLRIYMIDQSIKQVARDLNLGLTTVTSYIENVKNKLNCHTKQELLEKANILEALGYI
ncbi:MAG TPA: LuxR C-terminal-related transcriptional regulator [Gammaproteobacteria bacterium]|nr:LuxR C-terminal-related transcriptional regulator [Gammaproteobacteria bacterium]